MSNASESISAQPPELAAVKIYSNGQTTAGMLVCDEFLDSDGATVSVLGCKSGIVGRKVRELILVRLSDGTTVPARITHIHAMHDRFRAEIDRKRLPHGMAVSNKGELKANQLWPLEDIVSPPHGTLNKAQFHV